MRLDNSPGQVQAQSGTGRSSLSFVSTLHILLEDPILVARRDAGTVIDDFEANDGAGSHRSHLDGTAVWGALPRVVEQIPEHLADPERIGQDVGLGQDVGEERVAARQVPIVSRRRRDQFGGWDRPQTNREVVTVDRGDRLDVRREGLESVRLGADGGNGAGL